jgi:hypothetical protein
MLVVIVGGDDRGKAESKAVDCQVHLLGPFEVLTIVVDVVRREPLEHKRLEREPVVWAGDKQDHGSLSVCIHDDHFVGGEDQAKPTVWPDFMRIATNPKSQDRSGLRCV